MAVAEGSSVHHTDLSLSLPCLTAAGLALEGVRQMHVSSGEWSPRRERVRQFIGRAAPASVSLAAMLAVVLGLAAPAAAQSTPLARLECTAGSSYPSCSGWGPWGPNQYHTLRVVDGAGPSGQQALQFDQVPATTHAQYYMGFSRNVGSTPPAGTTRYLRLRIRPLTPINLAGVADVWTDKFIIVGDGDNAGSRVICHLRDNGSSSQTMALSCSRNIDGPPNATGLVQLNAGQWNHVQIEMRSSSSGSTNGRLAMWLNAANSNYGSPTSQSGAMSLGTNNWQNVNIGFYANATISSSGRASYQIADFEVDDAFDAGWNSGTGGSTTPPPAAPTDVRIIREASILGPGTIVALIAWRRRRARRSEHADR
jgi:hypothetical protein